MLIVQKFGGTSVFGMERIRASTEIVKRNVLKGNRIIVVVSAMAGETDRLINLYKESCFKGIDVPSEMDSVISTGEEICAGLFATGLTNLGIKARSFNGIGTGIITDDNYNKASIKDVILDEVLKAMDEGFTPVITGFQGFCIETRRKTTLGRGGSDTSALAIAAAVRADKCEIYKDVEGVLSGDPSALANVKKIDYIDYGTMLEVASGGSKVLEKKSIGFAAKYGIDLEVKSSFKETVGTKIHREVNEKAKIENISFSEKEVLAKMQAEDLGKNRSFYRIVQIDENGLATILLPKTEKVEFKTEEVVQIGIIGIFLNGDGVLQRALKIIKSNGLKPLLISFSETKISFILKANVGDVKSVYQKIHSEFIS